MDSMTSLFLYMIPFILQAGLLHRTISIQKENNRINQKNKNKMKILKDDGDEDEDDKDRSDGDDGQVDLRRICLLRLLLLPITLSLLIHSLSSLKRYSSSLSSVTRLNLGCSFATQFFKAFILTFQNLSLSSASASASSRATAITAKKKKKTESKDEKNSSTPSDSQSTTQVIYAILRLAMIGDWTSSSSDSNDLDKNRTSSKESSSTDKGLRQGLGLDLLYLFKTIIRLIYLQSIAVISLICWKEINRMDPRTMNHHHSGVAAGNQNTRNIVNLLNSKLNIKSFEGEAMTLCWGILVWTTLDFIGTLINLSIVLTKVINKLMIPLIKKINDRSINDFQLSLARIDLKNKKPHFKSPYLANSLTSFWTDHWHSYLKETFVSAGSIPISLLLVNLFHLKPNSPAVKFAAILGAFTISAAIHEMGLWSATWLDTSFTTFKFFLYQGFGVCLENGFRYLTGKRVDGLIGKIWMFSFLIIFAKPMIIVNMNHLSFDHLRLFQRMDQIGFWNLMVRPLSTFRLFRDLI